MKIVVTGGSGFVGTNSLIYLQEQYPKAEIVSYDIGQPIFPIRSISYIHGDVRSYFNLKKITQGSEKVFHFAAELGTHETFVNPDVTNITNINGTINLLELSREQNFKLFVASKPNVWLNPYSISKEAAEKYCEMYWREYKTQVAILKFFSIYGPYQYVHKYQKAVPYFIYQALNGNSLSIYGDGTQQADFVFVDDAVSAADKILKENIFGEQIEFASGQGTKVIDLANLIIKLTGSRSKIEFKPMRIGENANSVVVANLEKSKRLLKCSPKINLESGILKTIDFYRSLLKKDPEILF